MWRNACQPPKSMFLTARLHSPLLFVLIVLYKFDVCHLLHFILINSSVYVCSPIKVVVLHLPPQISFLLYSGSQRANWVAWFTSLPLASWWVGSMKGTSSSRLGDREERGGVILLLPSLHLPWLTKFLYSNSSFSQVSRAPTFWLYCLPCLFWPSHQKASCYF